MMTIASRYISWLYCVAIVLKEYVHQVASGATSSNSVADASGIPGWDRVGQLAQILVGLKGIAVSATQADQLKSLYDSLHDYDKKGVKAHLKAMPQL